MRRLIAILLVAGAAAAAALVLGTALGAGADAPEDVRTAADAAYPTAPRSPLAGLNARFRRLASAGACDAGAPKAKPARRLRAAALKGAAKAPPKVLKRKKASMRRAIALMRAAGDLCAAAQVGAPAPGAPAPGGVPPASPPPPVPGTPTIALSASGSTLRFVPGDPLNAATGPLHLVLTNNATNFMHSIGVRSLPGPVPVSLAPAVQPGGSTSLDVVLPPGSYEVYCGVDGHADQGMVLPLAVS